MPATFGSAVTANAKTVVDTNASQDTGAVSTGINFGLTGVAGSAAGTDEASISASRIGGAPGTNLKIEEGDGVGV